MATHPVSFVLNYQQTGKYALNVIAGSIMTQQNLRDIPVYFSKNKVELLANLIEAKQQSRLVLVGWSYYSPQFLEISSDLQHVTQQIVEQTTKGKACGKWKGQLKIAKELEMLQQK